MALTLSFLDHAGLALQDGRHTLLSDPLLTGHPVARHDPANLTCESIALPHGHSDPVGDTVTLARRSDATGIGVSELCSFLAERGVTRTAVVYHCGDTGLFGDMRLISDIYHLDVALIPIGDRYTMGPALEAGGGWCVEADA